LVNNSQIYIWGYENKTGLFEKGNSSSQNRCQQRVKKNPRYRKPRLHKCPTMVTVLTLFNSVQTGKLYFFMMHHPYPYYLCPDPPNCLVLSGFLTKILYVFLTSPYVSYLPLITPSSFGTPERHLIKSTS